MGGMSILSIFDSQQNGERSVGIDEIETECCGIRVTPNKRRVRAQQRFALRLVERVEVNALKTQCEVMKL